MKTLLTNKEQFDWYDSMPLLDSKMKWDRVYLIMIVDEENIISVVGLNYCR